MIDVQQHSDETHTPDADDLTAHLESIAGSLASLSEYESGPVGYELSVDPFESDEVKFVSNSWVLRLAQVQAWLHLDEPLDAAELSVDIGSVLGRFFKSIGQRNPSQCFDIEEGQARLSNKGAESIAARLESACRRAQQFHECLEETSQKEATAEWDRVWSDEEEWSEADPEPIKAKTDNWRINDFAGKASKQQLNLNPTYQRGDVWPIRDAQKLIESILRGIPLPSIILLKPKSDDAKVVYEVVDGKQRLTSILRFIGKHPAALRRVAEADKRHPKVCFKKEFQDNYKKFRRLWKTHMGESLTAQLEGQYYFPFPLPRESEGLKGPLEPLAGKYFFEIRDAEIQVGNAKETVAETFEGSGDYKIPLIEYLDASPRQIHHVFHLYNKQGKHLNAEEIRNAVYHELDFVKLVLVAAGDNLDIETLAGYLEAAQKAKLVEIARLLDDYRFGVARYKRTKVLSWLVALVLSPSVGEEGLLIRSTAKQTDSLLKAITGDSSEPPHPLRDRKRLGMLVDDVHRCVDVHAGCPGWHKKFMDDKDGAKWQELQLVASLVGVFLVCAVRSDAADLLDKHRDELLRFTRDHPRPRKTQNKTQWAFIGEVALGMLELLKIDLEHVDAALIDRYAVTCLPTLRSARVHYDKEA